MRSATTYPRTQIALGKTGSRGSLATRVSQAAGRWWLGYRDRKAQRATVRILMSLDQRTLADIGINPSEIQSCVYGGRDRTRRYNASWWLT
jgi:uncharacterized protein YjiS (DUF1127 family)